MLSIGLEITDVFGARPLLVLPVTDGVELGNKIVPPSSGKITGAAGAAEGAPALGNRAVAVRARKARIQHNLEYFSWNWCASRNSMYEIVCRPIMLGRV